MYGLNKLNNRIYFLGNKITTWLNLYQDMLIYMYCISNLVYMKIVYLRFDLIFGV
jgi:hypothetical protein